MKALAPLRSVRAQLVLLVAVALAPSVLLILLIMAQQRTFVAERALNRTVELARVISAGHGELIESSRVLLTTMANTPAIQEQRRDECNQLAERVVRSATSYLSLGVADPEGNVWCRYPDPENLTNVAATSYFQRAIESRGFAVGGFAIGQVTRQRILTLGYPVYGDDGALQAVIGVGVDVTELNQRVQALNLAPEFSVLLADRDGKVVIAWPEGSIAVGEQVPAGPFREALLNPESEGDTPVAVDGPDGVSRDYFFRTVDYVPDRDLIVTVGLELETTLEPVNQSVIVSVSFGLFLILAAGLAAWWFGDRRLARPIRSLAYAARRIQLGQLQRRAEIPAHSSELHTLIADFNAMAENLQKQAEELQAANVELERRVEHRTQRLKTSLEELRRSREQLRLLTGRQRQILEDEQTRISREVHDQLGQALTGAKMDVAQIERRLRGHVDVPGVAEALEVAQSLNALMDETVQTARAIARRLRPSLLDDIGLTAAIEWMARDVAGRADLDVILKGDDVGPMAGSITTAAYRIAQEAVTNVVRHARAHSVTIELHRDEKGLRMTIVDDGVGMRQPADVPATLGMLGMRERAEDLGGSVVWEAGVRGGTRVSVYIPFQFEGRRPETDGATPNS